MPACLLWRRILPYKKDWTYYKLQEKNGGFKRDWENANTDPKQLVLTGVWSAVLLVFFGIFISDCLAGKYATP